MVNGKFRSFSRTGKRGKSGRNPTPLRRANCYRPYPPALLRVPCQCLFPPSQEARFARGDFRPPATDPDISQIAPARVLAAAAARR